MKDNNLLVSVKRAGQTTKSLQGDKPWTNLLETLEVSHQDQVWVGDITYVRLNGRFIYVCLLMDVFTRIIKAWQISQHLSQSLTLKPIEEALCHSVPEIHHSDQGAQYLSKAYITTLQEHGVEISVALHSPTTGSVYKNLALNGFYSFLGDLPGTNVSNKDLRLNSVHATDAEHIF